MKLSTFLLSLAVICLGAAADSNVQQVSYVFDGDSTKFDKAADKLFARFDVAHKGYVNADDIAAFFHHGKGMFHAQTAQAMRLVTEDFVKFDTDNNGNVTGEEFRSGVRKFSKTPFSKEKHLCDKAKAALHKCKAELKSALKESPDLGVKLKLAKTMCAHDIAGLTGYSTQKCVIAASSCDRLVQCYSAQPNTAVALGGHSDGLVVKRANSDVLRIIYWISVIMIGALFVITPLFPFYVVITFLLGWFLPFDKADK